MPHETIGADSAPPIARKRWEAKRARHKSRRPLVVRLLAAAAATALSVTGLSLAAMPATAATHGYGYNDSGNGFIGQEMIGGVATYCLQITAPPPVGQSGFVGNQAWSTMNANDNARVNFAVTEFGQRPDNNWASAVHLYVWSLADTAEYNSHGMSGDDYYIARAPSSEHGDIRAKLAYIRGQAAGITAGATGGGSVDLNLYVDARNNYLGTITVSAMSPSNATGTLTLTNGVFTDNGTNSIAGVANGMVLNVTGVPPEEQPTYKISVHGVFTAPGGYAGQIGVYHTENGAQQYSGGPGPKATTHFEGFGEDPNPRSALFQPVVTTAVAAKFIQRGDTFTDTLTFSTTEDDSGLNNPWIQNPNTGQYAPLHATGVLYGPFNQQPTEADIAPSGAPVAARAEVTTTFEDGPNVAYDAESLETAEESGFYTWVWTIDAATQVEPITRYITNDYLFVDRFGQVAETHVSPSLVVATTKASETDAALGTVITDTLEVSLRDGAWLRDAEGNRIPVTFTGTAYFVPGATELSVSADVPAGAVALGSAQLTTSKVGSFTSDGIAAPRAEAGAMTWVWRIAEADQPEEYRGYVAEWADQFGLPLETTIIHAPTVTTKALAEVALTDGAFDIATVEGPIPAFDMHLTFEAFEQAEGATAPVCEVENRVFDTSTEPIIVSEAGDYKSAVATFPNVLDYNWVETLTTPEGEVIHRGECGAKDETTTVVVPEVVTSAVEYAPIYGTAVDTATVNGLVPTGATLVFDVYRQPEVGDVVVDSEGQPVLDESGEPVLLTADNLDAEHPQCEASNLVGTTVDDPVAVTAGSNDSTTYDSPPLYLDAEGRYFWIETLLDREGEELHRGDCGAPGETTIVEKPTVTTKAVPSITLGDKAHDVAIVDGLIPEDTFVVFEAFQPSGNAAVCTAATSVFSSSNNPVAVDAGDNNGSEYVGPEFEPSVAGNLYWVETLYVERDGQQIVIHEGECGAPGETTIVKPTPPGLASTGFNAMMPFVFGGLLLAAGASLIVVRLKRRESEVTTD